MARRLDEDEHKAMSTAAHGTRYGAPPTERDELGAIVDDALPRIFGYILIRVGNDRATAEDLTQETMLALAHAWRGGNPRVADPLAWLFGTARFKVIDHYRARQSAGNREVFLPVDLDGAANPIDDFERVLERDELEAELIRLPENQRLALLLHYGDGLTVAEVATALQRSEHAIESLLARGRRTIRENRLRKDSES
jgi:RNA polymerase sigma factor (sigma-70 family)